MSCALALLPSSISCVMCKNAIAACNDKSVWVESVWDSCAVDFFPSYIND